MNPIYEQYKEEYPQELVEIARLKRYNDNIEKQLKKARENKLRKIQKCKEALYGNREKSDC